LRWLLSSTDHELIGVVTQPDKPVGRSQKIEAPPIKAALGGVSIPVFQPDRIKREEAIAQIRAPQPQVIVVMAYGQILPCAVLEIPSVACLNLHASLLPRHRGAAPIQAAITTGDAASGITVMYMDEGLDTGDILLESSITLAPDETGGSLHDRLAQIAPDALAQALALLETGNAPRQPQDNTRATHAPKLQREHGRIDPSESAESIERKIRAYDPWPGTYLMVSDPAGRQHKLKIFPPVEPQDGSTESIGILRLRVSDGALLLREAQLEGGKRMAAEDLIRGHPWLAAL
jgi:methionyl-tRNA formyltransferase